MEALGAVLTDLRTKKGLSYQDVAEKVGVDDSYLNKIEAGKRNPTMKVVQALADFHGIKLSRLIVMAERRYERKRKRLPESRGSGRSRA